MGMEQTNELREYDRLLKTAGGHITTVTPRPDLIRVAAEAGISIDRARELFADDDALAAALVQEQMMMLTDAVTRGATTAPAENALARLRATAHAYLDWFLDNPRLAQLLIHPPAMDAAVEADVRRFSTGIYNFAQSMIEQARAEGQIRQDIDIATVLLTMRALTIGISRLQDVDYAWLWEDPDDPKTALRRVVDDYLDLATALPSAEPTSTDAEG